MNETSTDQNQVTLSLDLVREIRTALTDARDLADEQIQMLCGDNPPTKATIGRLSISYKRLAQSFYGDWERCQNLLKQLEKYGA